MRKVLPASILVVMLGLYAALSGAVWKQQERARLEVPAGYVIPSKFSRVLALGQQGLLSDFLFLKTITFVGGRIGSGMPLSEDDWRFVEHSLDVVTDLDPYFKDPYVLTEGLLAWDAGLIAEANQLLAKGMAYRTDDWQLPFFIGFNQFYFLKDFTAATESLMVAARLPGSPSYLKTLAARIGYYGDKSKTALLFLQELVAEADDPLMRARLQKRLQVLEGSVVMEEALDRFVEDQGRNPEKLVELIETGYLEKFPVEPYGGTWIFNKEGRVFSTSRFVDGFVPQEKD